MTSTERRVRTEPAEAIKAEQVFIPGKWDFELALDYAAVRQNSK
jgi:hypothetical protein